jgi:uncharacterized protein
MFNLGRLILFPVFGAVLGLLGNKITLTTEFNSLVAITLGLLMFALGAQMLGVERFKNFVIRLPKIIGREIADESNFKGKLFPFLVGGLTFFVPCGFTLIAQLVSLASRNPISGSLIMFAFALGTLPALGLISGISIYSNKDVKFGEFFNNVAGILIVVFALISINNQFFALNLPSISAITNLNELIEFAIFILLFLTLLVMAIKSFRVSLNNKNGNTLRLFNVIIFVMYALIIISLLLHYNLVLPWEYKLTLITK